MIFFYIDKPGNGTNFASSFQGVVKKKYPFIFFDHPSRQRRLNPKLYPVSALVLPSIEREPAATSRAASKKKIPLHPPKPLPAGQAPTGADRERRGRKRRAGTLVYCIIFENRIIKNMAKRQWLKTAEYYRLTDKKDYIVQVYKNDIAIKKPSVAVKNKPGVRSDIFEFSKASARRLSFVCRNSGYKIKSQICLTFHEKCPSDGLELKNMLHTLLMNIRNKYKDNKRAKYRDVSYLWCLEFQERGFPHFHLFTSLEPSDKVAFRYIVKSWLKIIGETKNAKCKWWHNRPENFRAWDLGSGSYMIKEYITKAKQKDVPEFFHNVGRFWGCSRSMKPVAVLIKMKQGDDDEKKDTDDLPKGGDDFSPRQASSGELESQSIGAGGNSHASWREFCIPQNLVVKTVRICKKLAERRIDNYRKLSHERKRIFEHWVGQGCSKGFASSLAKKTGLFDVLGEKRVAKSLRIGDRESNFTLWFMSDNFKKVILWLGGAKWNNLGYV